MEITPGYKRTEVGVIPTGWQAPKVGEVCGFIVPGRNKPKLFDGDIPWITTPDLADGGTVSTSRLGLCVSSAEAKAVGSRIVPAGSVLMSCAGELGIVAIAETEIVINQQLHAFIPTDRVDGKFLLNALAYRKEQIAACGTKTAVPYLNKAACNSIALPLPPLPEQRVIAAALSDVDALLAGLDRLISKKRDLKQAAMQQLLSGKTRLPGCVMEWGVKTLGELGSTFGGLTGKTKADFGDGTGHYVTFMNVMTNVVIDCGSFDRVRVLPTESQNRVMKGDLLFNGSSETPEEVAMCGVLSADVPDLFLNSFCFGFRFREGAEAAGLFLAYYFRSEVGRELVKSLAQGSTRYNLSKGALLKAALRLPSLPEQIEIASVLSDMDAELSTLQARRDKTRALKQGMMHELLTGKTRLGSTGGNDA